MPRLITLLRSRILPTALLALLLFAIYTSVVEHKGGAELSGQWRIVGRVDPELWMRSEDGEGASVKDVVGEERYITANFEFCGQLGNLLFRFASLYGIGKKVGRRPYFADPFTCYRNFLAEAEEVFPELAKELYFPEPPPPDDRVVVYASDHCCKYVDPLSNRDLVEATEKWVRISGDYLQHYRFFADSDADIRRMLAFAPAIQERADDMAGLLFAEDADSHKLCVSHRVSGFPPEAVSEVPFTWAAVNYTRSTLVGRRRNSAMSVVLLGDDSDFLLSLQINLSSAAEELRLHHVHVLLPDDTTSSRGERLCFAAAYCDSLLITAPASTYAWWTAYLLMGRWSQQERDVKREAGGGGNHGGGLILYNGDVPRRTFGGASHFRDNFPPGWIPLMVRRGKEEEEDNDLGEVIVLPAGGYGGGVGENRTIAIYDGEHQRNLI